MRSMAEHSAAFETNDFDRYGNTYLDYIALLGAIIRSGIQAEGIDYLRGTDGQAYCWLGGLEPGVVWAYAQREKQEKQEREEKESRPRGAPRRRVLPSVTSRQGVSANVADDPGEPEEAPRSGRKRLPDASVAERYAFVTLDQEGRRKPRLPRYSESRIEASTHGPKNDP